MACTKIVINVDESHHATCHDHIPSLTCDPCRVLQHIMPFVFLWCGNTQKLWAIDHLVLTETSDEANKHGEVATTLHKCWFSVADIVHHWPTLIVLQSLDDNHRGYHVKVIRHLVLHRISQRPIQLTLKCLEEWAKIKAKMDYIVDFKGLVWSWVQNWKCSILNSGHIGEVGVKSAFTIRHKWCSSF